MESKPQRVFEDKHDRIVFILKVYYITHNKNIQIFTTWLSKQLACVAQ